MEDKTEENTQTGGGRMALYEAIRNIAECVDYPDARQLIRRYVDDALSYRPRVCDLNDCKKLTDFILGIYMNVEHIRNLDDYHRCIVESAIRAALEIAYETANVKH